MGCRRERDISDGQANSPWSFIRNSLKFHQKKKKLMIKFLFTQLFVCRDNSINIGGWKNILFSPVNPHYLHGLISERFFLSSFLIDERGKIKSQEGSTRRGVLTRSLDSWISPSCIYHPMSSDTSRWLQSLLKTLSTIEKSRANTQSNQRKNLRNTNFVYWWRYCDDELSIRKDEASSLLTLIRISFLVKLS